MARAEALRTLIRQLKARSADESKIASHQADLDRLDQEIERDQADLLALQEESTFTGCT